MIHTFKRKLFKGFGHRSGRNLELHWHRIASTRGWRLLEAVTLLVFSVGAGCGDSRHIPIAPEDSAAPDGSVADGGDTSLQGVPLAFVANQDDTTVTTIRLDGRGPAVVNTLPIGPPQPDAIGGMAFSSGEWLFVTNTASNWVATIDPRGTVPIFEEYLTANKANPLVKIGRAPTRIYRDPVDREVVWTINEGDAATGIDTINGCKSGGSVSALHNSHLGAGGVGPHVMSKVCLDGKGPHDVGFLKPSGLEQELVLASSESTGLVNVLLPISGTGGSVAWGAFPGSYDLCDSEKEAQLGYPVCDAIPTTPNHSAPKGMVWSSSTGSFYTYLSGYQQVAELDPKTFRISRRIEVGRFQSVEIVPGGRFLILVGVDVADPIKVLTKIAFLDVTAASATVIATPIDNIRPYQFRFTPDGKRLYIALANDPSELTSEQAAALKADKLIEFDTSSLPTVTMIREMELPPVGTRGLHGLDLWTAGPNGSGSAMRIVVTNAQSGSNGTISLIDPRSGAITATIPVGKNPKQVVVYYTGLAASDNQSTPTW